MSALEQHVGTYVETLRLAARHDAAWDTASVRAALQWGDKLEELVVSAVSSSTSTDIPSQLDSALAAIATDRRLAACAPGLPVRLPRGEVNAFASEQLRHEIVERTSASRTPRGTTPSRNLGMLHSGNLTTARRQLLRTLLHVRHVPAATARAVLCALQEEEEERRQQGNTGGPPGEAMVRALVEPLIERQRAEALARTASRALAGIRPPQPPTLTMPTRATTQWRSDCARAAAVYFTAPDTLRKVAAAVLLLGEGEEAPLREWRATMEATSTEPVDADDSAAATLAELCCLWLSVSHPSQAHLRVGRDNGAPLPCTRHVERLLLLHLRTHGRRLLLRFAAPAVVLAAAVCFGVCNELVGLLLDDVAKQADRDASTVVAASGALMRQLVSVGGHVETYVRAVVSRAGLQMALFGVEDEPQLEEGGAVAYSAQLPWQPKRLVDIV